MKTLLTCLSLCAALFVPLVVAAQTPPTITTQPVDTSALVNGTATFTVAATGSPTPTYQWLKDGISIPDASWRKATLTLTGVSTNDVTYYSVVVTNSAGSVTSNRVKLTIGPSPVVVPPPVPPAPVPAVANMVSLRFNKDGSTYLKQDTKAQLTIECGAGLVTIDVATGVVTLPDPAVQPLDQTAIAWWLAVVNAFPEAKKQIKAAP